MRLRRSRPNASSGAPIDLVALRSDARGRSLRPFEKLMPADRARFAERILGQGWVLGRHPAIALTTPLAWDRIAAADRSWHYHLQSWDPLGPLLAAGDEHDDTAALALAADVALDWAQAFPALGGPSPFAWYDMAVGLRAYRLGYLVDVLARTAATPDSSLERLARCAVLHREALDDEAGFASHSNHGLYQALGHLALAKRLPTLEGMAASARLATGRLRQLVADQFTPEGVHREHSPGYHLLVLDALVRADAGGLIDDPVIREACRAAEAALPWMVQPDRRLAAVGDTSHGFAPSSEYRDPGAQFTASGGTKGSPPPDGLRVFRASGLAIVRERWGDPDGSYLFQTAAFHSPAHKHADDLSLVWMEQGVQLLADGGRYGYQGRTRPGDGLWELGFNYAAPERVYVESDRAHSTIEVDGGPRSRRGTPAYGSALTATGSAEGLHATRARVRIATDVTHTRLLVFAPGRWLLVVDDVEGAEPHRYRQRFLLGPSLDLFAGTQVSPRFTARGGGPTLSVVSLAGDPLVDLARGAREPELLGWLSRRTNELEPTWTCALAADDVRSHRFATLLSLQAGGAVAGEQTLDAELQNGAVSWTDGDGEPRGCTIRTSAGRITLRAIGKQ